MASYVYFKFKSQKEPQRVPIDGPHTDVWNLKREIITLSHLGDGTDFDLKIYKENSNEEYTDDTEIIPKDSTVLARRLPASAPGKGRAARYVSGKPPVSAKPSSSIVAGRNKAVDMDKAMTEQEKLQAMFKYTDAQWQQKQEEMSHETRVPIQGGKPFMKKVNVPEGEPPHGYICYRCGKKGHWIQACPTNDDASFDNKSRIKRTTGIPRSMLKKIDQSDIDKLDESQRHNLMVNAEGEYVFAQADEKAWRKHQEQVKAAEAAQKRVQQGNQELKERGLECPIDKRLFVDPMKTPCCGKTYCHDCIENALLENDLTCPGCETENISLERLEPDEDMKEKIKAYQDDKANEKQRSRSPSTSVYSPKEAVGSESGSRPATRDGSKSPASTNDHSKKRSADDEAPTSDALVPPAMKRQKSAETEKSAEAAEEEVSETLAESEEKEQDQQENSNSNDASLNNVMPPDMSQMMQSMGMNFPMGMPGMSGMPFMNMPGMMNMPMGMGMNMNMNMMPNMPFMPPNFNMMNGMNGMFPSNNNNNNNFNQFPNYSNQNRNFSNHNNSNNNYQAKPPSQPTGMSGVPTGPKAMNQNNYPPTGLSANKFSNQQRHVGNEEDNAYMRQPVNPHRAGNRARRARQADYREL